MEIHRRHLKKARPEDVRRLARWLKLRNIDEMSDRQLISLLHWLFTRREKKQRGLAWNW